MRLKSISINGFKSFADKTDIKFNAPITVIVGPNGCGKSNVLEAMKWSLGEQGPRALRCGSMQDIIFKGNVRRPPLNWCEVSLEIDNSSKKLSMDTENVKLTRKVKRDGICDYYINDNPALLREVQDLIMDSGLNKNMYSIVGQGEVSKIATSSAKDRMVLFEEAAGILKYKTKKKQALNQLKNTKDDLNRIHDILTEKERQLNMLGRQAGKARRYKKLYARQREISLFLTKDKILGINDKKKTLSDKNNELKRLLSEKQNELAELKTKAETLNLNIIDFEKELKELSGFKETVKMRLIETEHNSKMLEEKIANLRNLIEISGASLRKTKEEHSAAEKETAELSVKLKEIEEEKELLEKEKERLNLKLNEIRAELDSKRRFKNELRTKLKDGETEKFNAEKQVETLKTRLSEKQLFLNELNLKKEKLSSLKRSALEKNAALKENLNGEFNKKNDYENQAANLNSKKGEITSKLAAFNEEINKLSENLQTEKSQMKFYGELVLNLKGYYQGVQNVMRNTERFKGVCGIVSDLIQTDIEFEKAVSAALSSKIQNIIVEDYDSAKEIINYLKTTNGGRVTLLPAADMEYKEFKTTINFEGFDGYVIDKIRFDEKYKNVFSHILCNAVIFRDIDSAVNFKRQTRFKGLIVSLQGDTIAASGSISGGSSYDKENFLTRKRKYDEVKERFKNLAAKLQNLKQEEAELKNVYAEITSAFLEISEKAEAKEKNILILKKDIEAAEYNVDLLNQDIEEINLKNAALNAQTNEIKNKLGEYSGFAENSLTSNTSIESRLASAAREIENLTLNETEISAELKEKELVLARVLEQETAAVLRMRDGKEKLEACARAIDDLSARLEASEKDIVKHQEQINENGAVIENLDRQILQADGNLSAKNIEFSNLKGKQEETAAAVKKAEKTANEAREESYQTEMEMSELKHKLETEAQETIIKFKSSYDEIINFGYTPGEGVLKQDLFSELEEITGKIERMGSVNIEAQTEFEELKKDYDFLKEQKEDLETAREDLFKTIKMLDKKCREMFIETFNAVNNNFKILVKKLFAGGEAYLELKEDENKDMGIEIFVRPAGKKMQPLSLYSGGETALIAISLLFSIFMVKPSPFCILDEVDAPLDDVNLKNFLKLLKDFSSRTQFIIITHNKLTMKEGELIYGVTMQEAGVSKILSLKFQDGQNLPGNNYSLNEKSG